MVVHLLTYATHSDGMFDSFMDDANRYGIHIKVLGWGETWKGYFSKLNSIRKVIDVYPEDDAVVVMDGFDTRINGTMDRLLTIWETKYSSRVVFSMDILSGRLPYWWRKYFVWRVFGGIINAGMYMGKVGDLKSLLDKALKLEKQCMGDDQRAFNMLSKHITIDKDQLLFKNLNVEEFKTDFSHHDAIFLQWPGLESKTRFLRSLKEYTPFFWVEIITVLTGVVVIIKIISTLRFKSRKIVK